MRISRILFAVAIGACAMSAPALAVPEYVKTACKPDYKKFCPTYKVDTSELRACMVAISNQLSDRCIDALERSGEKRKK